MEVAVVEIDRVADKRLIADPRLVDARALRHRSGTNIASQALIALPDCAGLSIAVRVHSRIHTDSRTRCRLDGDSGLSARIRLTERRSAIDRRLVWTSARRLTRRGDRRRMNAPFTATLRLVATFSAAIAGLRFPSTFIAVLRVREQTRCTH